VDLREAAREQLSNQGFVPLFEIFIAREHARLGDVDDAIARSRIAIDALVAIGAVAWNAPATDVLVSSLLHRGTERDLREAQVSIDRLAAVPTDRGFVLHDLWLLRLRALLARARGDDVGYRGSRDRYRARAADLEFDGHLKWAAEMP
jgi:adenylate cyclase